MVRKMTIFFVPVLMLMVVMSGSLQAQSKTMWDGVYSTSQATSGQAIYTQYCAGCHAVNLNGGANQGAPPLKGEKWMENWREDSLQSLYTKIRTTMPRRDSKSLNEQETIDLVSYILAENEAAAGSDLSTATLGGIQIQRKDGPKPLPNYAIIQVVGCMTPEGDAWTLTSAGAPTRIRTSEKSTPDELNAAESKPLGGQTFRLQNLAMLGAFSPEAHKGHKMMAKGPLIRQANSERISVTELEMLGGTCGN